MAETATANGLNQLQTKENNSVTAQGTAANAAKVLVESADASGPVDVVASRPGTGNYRWAEGMESETVGISTPLSMQTVAKWRLKS